MGKLLIACSLFAITLAAASSFPSIKGAGDDLAHRVESQTLWMCRACNHHCHLTAHEVSKLQRRGSNGFAGLRCLACGANEAFLARTCSKSGTVYLGPDVPRVLGKCPTCRGGETQPTPAKHRRQPLTPAEQDHHGELEENETKPPVKVI